MRFAALFVLIAGISSAQVQSAADVFASASTSTIAQGSLAAIDFSQNTPTPVTSATVSLLPAASSTPIAAQVAGVSGFRIMFVVPADMPLGDAEVIYKPGNQATQWARASIVPVKFSLFRSGSIGPLIAQNVPATGLAVPNGLASPAQPGEAVVLWGTGLGATPPGAVQITLGGVAQTVLYAGGAPQNPGLNQINFQIAPGTPDGCYVPLTVAYGTGSATSFLSKTSDGLPCHHPFQLPAEVLALLDAGGQIQSAGLVVSTGIEAAASDRASRQESAQELQQSLTASSLAAYFAAPASAASPVCGIEASNAALELFLSGALSTGGTATLQSGSTTLTLPWSGPLSGDSPLNGLPAPVLASGNWTWSGSGGPLPSAASFSFVLPPPVQIAAGAPLALNRGEDQTVAWNGSGFDSTATLQLLLSASYSSAPVLMCTVPAQAGSVILPSSLLASFAAGSAGSLSVTVREAGSGIPHALLNLTGGTPFLTTVNWSSTDARPVDFQ